MRVAATWRGSAMQLRVISSAQRDDVMVGSGRLKHHPGAIRRPVIRANRGASRRGSDDGKSIHTVEGGSAWLVSAVVTAVGLLPVGAFGAAGAAPGGHSDTDFAADDFYYDHHAQHGPSSDHLPGSVDSVDLVGKLKLTNQVGDISDVSAMATTADGTLYAYLGTGAPSASPAACTWSTSATRPAR